MAAVSFVVRRVRGTEVINSLECPGLKQESGDQCHERHATEDDYHPGRGFAARRTYLRQLVKREEPFDGSEYKRGLNDSGCPASPQEEKPDQYERNRDANRIHIAQEMRAENQQAEHDRSVEQRFHQLPSAESVDYPSMCTMSKLVIPATTGAWR